MKSFGTCVAACLGQPATGNRAIVQGVLLPNRSLIFRELVGRGTPCAPKLTINFQPSIALWTTPAANPSAQPFRDEVGQNL